MIKIVKATPEHVEGISKVCIDGYWATYSGLFSKSYIEEVIREYYNHERILKEVTETGREWGGYFVALDGDEVVGAGGGGMIGDTTGELFVLYLNPNRRNEGIGTKLLDVITNQQKEFGAIEQWVSVSKGNEKGIPFYEARGFTLKQEKQWYSEVDGKTYVNLRYCRNI